MVAFLDFVDDVEVFDFTDDLELPAVAAAPLRQLFLAVERRNGNGVGSTMRSDDSCSARNRVVPGGGIRGLLKASQMSTTCQI